MEAGQDTQFRRSVLSQMRANDGQIEFRRLLVSECEELRRMEQEGLIRRVATEKHFLFTLLEQNKN